ncbi:MAG: hypothetical protein K2X27_24370, partial [Candidatus Obscuribacterales bacterium]|nr:hypothetical protein [Candidatus Obscuribacterales bacterium]
MKRIRKLPNWLYVVRHAKSLVNQRIAEADALGLDYFQIPMEEHLAPIVPEGEKQVEALAAWFAALPPQARP